MSIDPYFSLTETGDTAFAVEGATVKFGPGVLSEIGNDARGLGMSRVAVFTDRWVAKLKPLATVMMSLRNAGIDAVVYDEVAVEPTDTSFQAAIRFANEGRFDGFVSVGGGSVIDTCKAANLYSTYPDDMMAYVNAPIGAAKAVPGPLKPHIACPTTFGTASECTGHAICDFPKLGAKSGIVSKRMKPTLGLLDPEVLHTLPPFIVAANGFDVLTHAIESFTARPYTKRPKPDKPNLRPTSQGANPYSDFSCLEAIRIAGKYLEQAVLDPSNLSVREPLMFAGMLAGVGFNNAGCHIPHGMSYAVSGLAKNYFAPGYPQDHPMVPHGIAVVVNAPVAFRFTGPACPERHLRAAEALGADIRKVDPKDAGAVLANRFEEMMKKTGIPNGLSGVGFGQGDVSELTAKAMPQKRLLDNSPQPVGKEDLEQMFRKAITYWS
jgi:hydroxyacid-oxoacid transhydrogenase